MYQAKQKCLMVSYCLSNPRHSVPLGLVDAAKVLHTEGMENLSDYFQRVTGERSNRAMAAKVGADASTLNRQLSGATSITVEVVVAICRAYRLDFADAFVKAGFITHDEAVSFADSDALRRIPDVELAREIVRRLEAHEATEVLTDPLAVTTDESGRVVPLFGVGGGREDLAEVASESITYDPEDTDDKYDA
jgi:hypothetical protein